MGYKALEDKVVQVRDLGGKESGIRDLEVKTLDCRAKEDLAWEGKDLVVKASVVRG